MLSTEKVYNLLERNSGYLTAEKAREYGVANKTLQRMTHRGEIERIVHGLYISADIFPDPYYIAQYRCPKGIFSHETALFLHDLSDREPLRMMMTIPSGWNTKLLSDSAMLFFYSEPERMMFGLCDIETTSGMKVKSYDAERTICDCLRYVDRLDRDLVLTALKRYTKRNDRDNAKLLEYATTLKIRDLVYRYLEVLT